LNGSSNLELQRILLIGKKETTQENQNQNPWEKKGFPKESILKGHLLDRLNRTIKNLTISQTKQESSFTQRIFLF